MAISENYLAMKLAESGTPRDRVAAAVDDADDGWLLAHERHSGTLQEFARAAVGGAITAVAGDAARPDGEALAERVAFAAMSAAREVEGNGGDVALAKAKDAIRAAALTVATPGRPERLLDGLLSVPRADTVLVASLRALVGTR